MKLTKSKLLRGYQCKKALYLTFKHPGLETKPDEALRFVFDQGNEVGAYSRREYPAGVLVDVKAWEFADGLARTQELVRAKAPVIFEGFFGFGNLICRADILLKDDKGYQLIEVKSSTKVKEAHVLDVAIQMHIIEGAGLPLSRISVRVLNPACRFPHLENLFLTQDVTEEARERARKIPSQLEDFRDVFRDPNLANVPIGKHCDQPNECVFKAYCWREVPKNSTLELYRGTGWEYWEQGIRNIAELDSESLEGVNRRIFEAVKSDKIFHDRGAVQAATRAWTYPHYHLDFETISPAIPRFLGNTPYEKVPFQYSLDVDADGSKTLRHFEYLHRDSGDPRPEIAKRLASEISDKGSVIAYNMRFEGEVLEDLSDSVPEYREKLLAIKSRLVDPLPLLREHIYYPAFHGSFSIKAVAPAILGANASYSRLEIPSGELAPIRFEQMLQEQSVEKKEKLARALLEYCAQDTAFMVRLVRWMQAS